MRSSPLLRLRSISFLATAIAALGGCGGGAGNAETLAMDDGSQAMAAVTAGSTAAATTTKVMTAVAASGSSRTGTAANLIVRAHAQLAGNVGPKVEIRIGGVVVGTIEVRSTDAHDYTVPVRGLAAGTQVDVVYTNDGIVDGQDRNLFVAYVSDGNSFVAPSQPGVVFDRGEGAAALDGQDVQPGTEAVRDGGAIRFNWPSNGLGAATEREIASSRFLQQASFGPTRSEIARLNSITASAWLDEQLAMPVRASYLPYIQSKYNLGSAYLPPNSAAYTPNWLTQQFWSNAVTAPDQLRKRTAHALHSIFVTSLVDSNLFHHARAHAQYLDTLDRLAFGNFRELIEEVALSPVMGIYLSHIRNRKEDGATHRLPDENFARELMQLFTLGLHELNSDGTPRLNSQGQPIETYDNADVMAMAKVFTGWSWGFDNNALTEHNFLWNWPWPDVATQGSSRVDIRRMKPYPGQHSTAEKRLFAGKPHAVTIPAGTSATESVRIALDTLFRHPNVGPFISRQLIQRLVNSNPSPAYVQRVAAVFNDNGQGVRGDMGAVVRALLLDAEARNPELAATGKLREPVLRLAHTLRAFGARSSSGEFLMATEPLGLGQRALHMPSVFGYFRPGYVPPPSLMPGFTGTAPEFQTVDEATTANWINAVEVMLREGIGWHGNLRDVTLPLDSDAEILAGSPDHLLRHLELLLLGSRMPAELRKDMMDAMQGVGEGQSARRDQARVRVALLIAVTSPEYLIHR